MESTIIDSPKMVEQVQSFENLPELFTSTLSDVRLSRPKKCSSSRNSATKKLEPNNNNSTTESIEEFNLIESPKHVEEPSEDLPEKFTSNEKLSHSNDCSSLNNFTQKKTGPNNFRPKTVKSFSDKAVSTTPIKSVHDLHQVFSPHPEKDEVTSHLSIPRLVVTKATPIKEHCKIIAKDEILKKVPCEKSFVFKNF